MLSLCLIVKNEAAHLERCLASVRPLVDEIVVADTGSTDGTRDIARRHTDHILSFEWCDDFAAARNFVLDHAHGDWVLSLDADETIAGVDHDRIRAALLRDVDAVESQQRHYLIDGTVVGWQPGPGGYDEGRPYPGYFDVTCRRLFRRLPHLRWHNPVHEELVSLDPTRPLRSSADGWIIHHFGKADPPERLAAKAQLYLRLGVQKAAALPGDALAQYELGVQLQELKRWDEALEAFSRADRVEAGFRQTHLYIGICQHRLGRYDEALASLHEAARTRNCAPAEVALEQGNVYLAREEYDAAARAYRRVLRGNGSSAAATFNLALIAVKTGARDEALQWLARAIASAPHNTEARLLRASLRHEAHDAAGALADLDEIATDRRAARLRARVLLDAGRIGDAEAALRASTTDDSAERQALTGAVALAQGRPADALSALETAWSREQNVETALNLSAARLAAGDSAGALVAVAEALRLNPTEDTARARHRVLAPVDRARVDPSRDRPLRIYFWHRHSIPYDSRSPRTRGLGGTESAVIYLAEALAARGHRVAIFNTCALDETVERVEYARWETLPVRAAIDQPDVVVAVRDHTAIRSNRFAPLQLLWTGDAFDQPFLNGIAEGGSIGAIDLVMLQSRWQIETIQSAHGVPPWRVLQTRLGFGHRPADAAPNTAGRPRRLAYTSTPFRGLDVLLDLFPAIRARCPDAELRVFSSMRVYGMNEAEDRSRFERIYARTRQPGVELVGTVPQPVLARELTSCRLLAYPNHWPETFCIAAIEAQAAGCPVLTSAVGALRETVGDGGLCLEGDPRNAPFGAAFVDAAVELLVDEERWTSFSRRALTRAEEFYSWSVIAADWDQRLRDALAGEAAEVHRIAQHLAAGRAALASSMSTRTPRPAGVAPEAWDAVGLLTASIARGEEPSQDVAARVTAGFGPLRRSRVLEALHRTHNAEPLPFTAAAATAQNSHAE